MRFIPYQRLFITTDISKGEVVDRLKDKIGQRKLVNFIMTNDNEFSGQLNDNNFRLRLNKDYRNSWTPEIIGTINEKNDKTTLRVTLKLNSFVLVFTSIFIVIGLIMLIDEIIDFRTIEDFDLSLTLFLIIPYGLCWFGFNLDAEKAIDGLLKITKGEISNAR